MALSGRRRKKSASKAEQLRTNERNELESKREDDEASRRRINQA